MRGAGARRARCPRRAAVSRGGRPDTRIKQRVRSSLRRSGPLWRIRRNPLEKRMRTRRKRGEEGGSSQGGMRHLGVAVSMIRGPSLFRCRIISKGLGSSFRQLEYTHWESPFGQIQSFVTFLLSHRHISVAKRRKLCRTCGRTARQGAGFGSAFGFTPFGNRALQHKMNNIWVKNTRD